MAADQFLVRAVPDDGRRNCAVAGDDPDRQGGGQCQLDRGAGVDVHPRPRGLAGAAGGGRRLDDDDCQPDVLDHDRRAAARNVAVRAAVAPQLHARPRESGGARDVHRHLRVLPADPQGGQRHRGRDVRAAFRGHGRPADDAGQPGGPDLFHPSRGRRRSRRRHVIATVADELHQAIERLYPECGGTRPPDVEPHGPKPEIPADFERDSRPVASTSSDYLDAVDVERLLAIAHEADVVVEVPQRPGRFLVAGGDSGPGLAGGSARRSNGRGDPQRLLLWPAAHPNQDVEFAIDQLVEIAVRALSPGIHDPFTAITCIDRLAVRPGRATHPVAVPLRRRGAAAADHPILDGQRPGQRRVPPDPSGSAGQCRGDDPSPDPRRSTAWSTPRSTRSVRQRGPMPR